MNSIKHKTWIDNYITNLKEYFWDCTDRHSLTGNIHDNYNQDEKTYFNENLQLDHIVGVDKTLILNKVLQDKSKFNFAQHILSSLNIELEVNNIDETNKTTFELLIENAISTNDFFNYNQFIFLYKRGYKNTKSDELYLIDFYKTKISSQELLPLWCFARICFKLNNFDKIEKVISNKKVVLTLFSFNRKQPIGFNFKNLLSLANNAIEHYREYGDLILYAMKYYKVYDSVRQQDKKGTFKLKEEKFLKFKPIQDIEFNEIVYEIFSELRH